MHVMSYDLSQIICVSGDETSRRKNYKGLPEYWKFSHGIEPYETKEEVPILGLYSKILDTLKQHKVLNR